MLLGVAVMIYLSRTHQRLLLWASLVALMLGIFGLQSMGAVVLRGSQNTSTDALSKVMNGPRGSRIRIGLAILFVLLLLLGAGLLEPGRLGELLSRFHGPA